jgi:TonB-linked SusC/RagA family outer membrane protein
MIGVATLYSADRVITGKVTSENGKPLVGVTISVKGTTFGTVTKSGGVYTITVPGSADKLVFRFVGMKTKEVAIGSDDIINVQLAEDAVLTDEVVVTAIGMEREKKSLGYSIEEFKSSQIEDAKTTNIVNALSGKVAGVNVVKTSGVPGGASFITIRGISSLTGNNQPLFVVDGIPIDNSQSYTGNPDDGGNNLLYGVAYSNRAIDLAPEDIASMTILKGPAATALYGIRAASGVIIITTKRGQIGKERGINVNAGLSYGLEQVNKLPELQNKWVQGAPLTWFGEDNPGYAWLGPESRWPLSWGPNADSMYWDGQDYKYDKNGHLVGQSDPDAKTKFTPYDNVDNFYRTGRTLNTYVNMTGANEFGSFYLSVSNNKNFEGVVPNSNFERTSVRLNADAKIASFMKASANLNYINSGGRRIQQGSNLSGVMLGLLRTPISFDNSNGFGKDGAYNEEAYMFLPQRTQRTFRGETGDGKARYDNPFWTVNMNPFTDNVNRFIGNLQLDFFFNDHWTFMTRFGLDNYSDVREQRFAVHSNAFLNGQLSLHNLFNTDINWDNILTIDYDLGDDWNMKFNIGQNMYQSIGESYYIQGDELIIPEFYHISNTSTQLVRNGYGKLRRMAFYGDLTFNYKGWLFLNGALRNEWSTSLPEDNNSFLFGTINASWIFTEAFENVFKNSVISFGKFRANYAVVGKDAPIYATFTPYIQASYGDGWTNGVAFPFNGQVGFVKGDILGNKALQPEITKSWEVGLAMNFFENRLGFDITYYNSTGYDQIFSVPISTTTGYYRQIKNAGQISNKGIELLFNITPVKIDNFSWDLMLNFTKNTNNVDKLAPGIDNLFIGGFSGSSVRAVAGLPYGTIFGGGWMRDDNGNLVIDDDENSANYGYPIITGEEMAFGTYLPNWTMGITNSFNIYGVRLSFLFDFRDGGMMWNGTRGALTYFGKHVNTEDRDQEKIFAGVKQSDGTPNDIKVYPGADWYTGNGGGFSPNTEDFVEKTNWIRLRELSLAYTLSRGVFGTAYFPEITLSFTARNLWLSTDYSGIDPETNLTGASNAQGLDYFQMPNVRSYIFGIDFHF